MKKLNLEKRELRRKLSSRGGGVEVSLHGIKDIPENAKMTAYQNYLGGGMLGSIQSDCNLRRETLTDKQIAKLNEIEQQVKQYFADLMGFNDEEMSFLESMPASAY